jgi:ankyrin repeat protein
MEPIHQAAWDGDVAAIDLLVAEDGERLCAQIQGDVELQTWEAKGCTTLMLAAGKGHDTVVARLLALGADVELSNAEGRQAVHWAC